MSNVRSPLCLLSTASGLAPCGQGRLLLSMKPYKISMRLWRQVGKRHSPLTVCSLWIPCRSYSDSCFLDSPLYPELADVQWYGQEKAKPGTLVWTSRPQSDRLNAILRSPHCLSFALPRHTVTLHQLWPSALFPPVSASPHNSKTWLRRHYGRFRSHCVSPGSLAYREPGTCP